jgi:hypothetical protein
MNNNKRMKDITYSITHQVDQATKRIYVICILSSLLHVRQTRRRHPPDGASTCSGSAHPAFGHVAHDGKPEVRNSSMSVIINEDVELPFNRISMRSMSRRNRTIPRHSNHRGQSSENVGSECRRTPPLAMESNVSEMYQLDGTLPIYQMMSVLCRMKLISSHVLVKGSVVHPWRDKADIRTVSFRLPGKYANERQDIRVVQLRPYEDLSTQPLKAIKVGI